MVRQNYIVRKPRCQSAHSNLRIGWRRRDQLTSNGGRRRASDRRPQNPILRPGLFIVKPSCQLLGENLPFDDPRPDRLRDPAARMPTRNEQTLGGSRIATDNE